MSVRFWRDGDTEYRFTAVVVKRDGESFLLKHSAEIERVQLRDFFRVDLDFPITLFALPERTGDDEQDPTGDDGREGRAALVLLDDDPDGDSDQGEVVDAPEDGHPVDGESPRLAGRACDISAGGLSVVVRGDVPTMERWLIDPDFDEGFPLANLVCTIVGDRRGVGDSITLKLKYEDLPAAIESEIVRRVYQYQLISADSQHQGGQHAVGHEPADPPAGAD